MTLEELSNSLCRPLTSERRRVLITHILRGCEACCDAVRRGCLQPEARAPLTAEQDAAYDSALDYAADLARRADALSPEDQKQFSRALPLLASGRGILALAQEADIDVAGLGVYEALLARSWAVRYDNPQEMHHLARSAVEIAKSLDPLVHGAQGVADYQARAWGELGNAYRAADDLPSAERAFGQAFAAFKRGTGNRPLKTRLLDLQASYYGTLRDPMAPDTFRTVSALYQEAGEDQLAVRNLVTTALYTFYAGRAEEALGLNQQALDRIDPERQSALMTTALQNKLLFLTDLGRFREARKLLFESRSRFLQAGRVNQVKIRGIEGRINYSLGNYAVAEGIFRETKGDFSHLELGLLSAISTLDLGLTLLRQLRIDEAEQEVLQAAAVFVSLNIQHEILSCMAVLEESFRMRTVTVELMERSVWYIRKQADKLGIRQSPQPSA